MTDATDLLLRRRSVPPPMLSEPGPSEEQLRTILSIASRVPDHGKLAPWRFIVIAGEHRAAFADRLAGSAAAQPNADPQRIEQDRKRWNVPLSVAIISCAAPHVKIPEWEQVLSAGAVCMNMIVAAHAQGFAASWLTGKAAYDPAAAEILGLKEGEKVAGFIHIGTRDGDPGDRPRPPLDEIVTLWTGA
ncbi:nitroreductase family protein [Terrihabitans sp. B22-R8]|uniref:nitroreductase family protein n=1 Tax=Terrihabitans sp. B22-R8 TaxID=3425128 RepID=UPI00403CEDF4